MSACVAVITDGLTHSQFFYDVRMDNYLGLVLKHGGNPNWRTSMATRCLSMP